MIIYLLALLVAALMFHSLYALSVQYLNKKKPLWFNIYAGIGGIYVIGAPCVSAIDLTLKLGFENSIAAFVGGVVSIIITILICNVLPKEKNSYWD
ncbi:hypothetical protein [Sporotomaculum syntrophicum]|uniref:hypothetical protein n=1 Tax=Sporotomaculum syntrophicum TaxID=182264 RepID=UPI00137AAE8E|nr:hypothetical protein [Sporotomaculum syntrophicum]